MAEISKDNIISTRPNEMYLVENGLRLPPAVPGSSFVMSWNTDLLVANDFNRYHDSSALLLLQQSYRTCLCKVRQSVSPPRQPMNCCNWTTQYAFRCSESGPDLCPTNASPDLANGCLVACSTRRCIRGADG